MPDPLTFFAQRPGDADAVSALTREAQSRDLLSGLLRTVRLHGGGAVHLAPSPPFAIEFGETTAMVHIFERGGCELHITGQGEPRIVHEGEIVLLPRPRRHTIVSGSAEVIRGPERRDLVASDDHVGTPRWLAGSFAVDAPSGGQMLAELPSHYGCR